MYYEVIYETGEHSVMQADSDEEALRGISEQHRRAVEGLPGGPAGQFATRIKRVFVYDEHPGSLYEDQLIESKTAEKVLKDKTVGNLVSVAEVVSALRDELNPRVTSDPHESNFKMKEGREIESSEWEGVE